MCPLPPLTPPTKIPLLDLESCPVVTKRTSVSDESMCSLEAEAYLRASSLKEGLKEQFDSLAARFLAPRKVYFFGIPFFTIR